jgi:hypothetical protein
MQGSDKSQDSEKSQDSSKAQDSGKSYGSYQATVGDVKDSTVVQGDRNIVGDDNTVAYEAAAAAGPKGAAATDQSAAATEGAVATVGPSPASAGFVDRAKNSRWVRAFAVIALLATLAATGLLIAGVTDLGVAGYILAVVAVIVGVIPLLSSK